MAKCIPALDEVIPYSCYLRHSGSAELVTRIFACLVQVQCCYALHTVKTEMLWWYDQIEKDAVSVECWTQRCYCDLVRNVVYDNFQDILVPESDSYSALGNTRNSLRASSYISTVHSCNLNNKPLVTTTLLGVWCLMGRIWQLPHAMNLAWVLPGGEKCLVYS